MIPFTPTAEELPRLLDGSQSLIVRAVEPQPEFTEPDTQWIYGDGHGGVGWYAYSSEYTDEGSEYYRCPLGAPGGVVWCREDYFYPVFPRGWLRKGGTYTPKVIFATASKKTQNQWSFGEWKLADTMPEWAARLFTRIKSVDCRRVQTVTPVEAIAAGHGPTGHGDLYWDAVTGTSVVDLFSDEWDRNNPDRKTVSNPWAWFVQVERCERP